jgi:hypothetical protein
MRLLGCTSYALVIEQEYLDVFVIWRQKSSVDCASPPTLRRERLLDRCERIKVKDYYEMSVHCARQSNNRTLTRLLPS